MLNPEQKAVLVEAITSAENYLQMAPYSVIPSDSYKHSFLREPLATLIAELYQIWDGRTSYDFTETEARMAMLFLIEEATHQ